MKITEVQVNLGCVAAISALTIGKRMPDSIAKVASGDGSVSGLNQRRV